MNKKILKKFIAILLVCITILNTTSTFAAFSLFKRSSDTKTSISNIFSTILENAKDKVEEGTTNISSNTSRGQELIKGLSMISSSLKELIAYKNKVEEETGNNSSNPADTTETLENVGNIVKSVIEKYQKTTGFTNFLKKIFGKSNTNPTIINPKEVFKESLVLISKVFPPLEDIFNISDIDPDKLVTVFTTLSPTDLTDPKVMVATLKNLTKAIMNTTDLSNGMITKKDLTSLKENLTSGEFYYPDTEDVNMYTTIKDTARLSNYGMIANELTKGRPIGVGKVRIYGGDYGTQGKEVYMLCLNGTGFTEGQQYGIVADLLSGMETDSQYLRNAIQAIRDYAKEDNYSLGKKGSSPLYIAGMSLGGMIAQQVMVQDIILQEFKIEQVTIIGSPALCVEERKEEFNKLKYKNNAPKADKIVRIIDEQDLIPYACIDYLNNKERAKGNYFVDGTSYNIKEGAIIETLITDNAQKHYKTGIGHHFIGYLADETWKNYDPLGYKITDTNSAHRVKIDHSNFKYYDAPTYANGKLSKFF